MTEFESHLIAALFALAMSIILHRRDGNWQYLGFLLFAQLFVQFFLLLFPMFR